MSEINNGPVNVTLMMSVTAIGAPMIGEEFHFELLNENQAPVHIARNDAFGRITFHATFDSPGTHRFTVRQASGPVNYWQLDARTWPVEIHVENVYAELRAVVNYPEGFPRFENTSRSTTCGRIEFPELIFTAPGIYEYTLRELTPSGEGWTTDDSTIRVRIHVTDDGHGHLVATIEYPDGFPTFTNTYAAQAVRVKINACKIAIGAPLPEGRFEFGLFSEDGALIHTAKNGPADETRPDDDDDDGDE